MSEPKPRVRDRVAVAAFLLLFLIPMFLRSTVSYGRPLPGSPLLLNKLHEIACLFTHKPSGWSSYYVQIQRADTPTWHTLDQSELFPLQPFGRRTRMHRLFAAWNAKPGKRTEDMARWVLLRWAGLHPEEAERAPPVALRFTRTWMIPSRDEPPQHGWVHPEFYDVPPARRRVIVTYTVDDLFPEDR